MPEEHMHQRTHTAIAFLLLSEAQNYTSTGLRISLSKAAGLSGEAAHSKECAWEVLEPLK